jgi:putative Ca2+/H+ antiporter (TMEM165/GDT1 family)
MVYSVSVMVPCAVLPMLAPELTMNIVSTEEFLIIAYWIITENNHYSCSLKIMYIFMPCFPLMYLKSLTSKSNSESTSWALSFDPQKPSHQPPLLRVYLVCFEQTI